MAKRKRRHILSGLIFCSTPSCTSAVPGGPDLPPPRVGDCQIFPRDNPWNTDITHAPVSPMSDVYIASISAAAAIHPDFGSAANNGIPFNIVDQTQPLVPVSFTLYGDESDPGPYPIPADAFVELGGDGHLLVLDQDGCKLYEMFRAMRTTNGWQGGSGAVFDLKTNALRREGWTSTDAAGLPVFPGLIRYDEVVAGQINHALRFTVADSQAKHIHPATHDAGDPDPALPPMGLRVRLKASIDISGFSPANRVILRAMQRYGMFVADNGTPWYFQGEAGAPWDDLDLWKLHDGIHGSDFEVVETAD